MDWERIKGKTKELASKGLDISKDLAEKGIEVAKEKREQKKLEKQEMEERKRQEEQALKERIAHMEREGIVYCPKCYSTSLSANKKGFSLGKAAVGTLIAGGPLLGAVGKNKIEVTCLKCGHKWKAGKK
mgnify:CR=1 FL=1